MRALPARVRQHKAVADLGLAALASENFDALLRMAVEAVAETLGTDLASVLKRQTDRGNLILCAASGWKPGSVGHVTFEVWRASQAGCTMEQDAQVIVEA